MGGHGCANNGHADAVRLLLDAGADATIGDSKGRTPLMLAASAGDAAMVACLLAHGADVALTDPDGYSATHWLCVRGDHSAVLALLLDAGADINARTNFGSTPLIIAAKYGYAGCAVLLIDRGGDVLNLNARAGNGQTALHEAAKHGRRAPHDPHHFG